MSTCIATLIEMFNKDMERAALEDSTESPWGAMQKNLGENFLGQKNCGVDDDFKKSPDDDDLSAAQNHDVFSSKLPLDPFDLNKSPVQTAVRETEMLLSALNVSTAKQDKHSMPLLTGNEDSGRNKAIVSQMSAAAEIHPHGNLQTENVLEEYPSNYNQRTPEQLHMLFGAVPATTKKDSQDEKTFAGIHLIPSNDSESKMKDDYPTEYNHRTPEHLHSLFGVQNEEKTGLVVHPVTKPSHDSKSHTNERKILGNYPIGYNQRSPEHLHSLFGATQTTENQGITTAPNTQCKVSSRKARSKKNVPIILGSYPKDYNKRTKEHLHFLFGAKAQPQMKDEEKKQKNERKNKQKKNDKQKKMNNKTKKGQQTSNTSTSSSSETSPKEVQKDKTSLLAFLRISRNKKHA